MRDIYCYAEQVPDARGQYGNTVFPNVNLANVTLHVPAASIETYSAEYPWSAFGRIVALTGVEGKKCATPTIAFVNGELTFSCETEGVEYAYEVTNADVKKGNASKVVLTGMYRVSVYATKEGYEDSDVATLEFTLGSNGEVCDVNGDGFVNVADIVTIISEMSARARMQGKTEE